jgi:transcription antitermination factor NusG
MTLQWFVVEANPSATSLAAHSIRELGLTVFLPEFVQRVRKGNVSHLVRKPLLYGYLFAQFDMANPRWPQIFSRRGVRTMMVDAQMKPKPVPDNQIEEVRKIAGKYEGVVCEQVPLTKDQAVMIIDGAFSGIRGTVKSTDHVDKVVVELQTFGRPTRTTVPRQCVAPAA